MNLYGKEIILFPEYHLSDFPPQVSFTQSEADDINIQGYEEIITDEDFKHKGEI
jgi:hypothetical protein